MAVLTWTALLLVVAMGVAPCGAALRRLLVGLHRAGRLGGAGRHGATRFETARVLLRQITPGIATATLFSVGRAIGDAAGVMFTAGFSDSLPSSLTRPAATLPLSIFFQLNAPPPWC